MNEKRTVAELRQDSCWRCKHIAAVDNDHWWCKRERGDKGIWDKMPRFAVKCEHFTDEYDKYESAIPAEEKTEDEY